MRILPLFSAAVLVLTVTACAQDGPGDLQADEAIESADDDGKADGVLFPYGTFAGAERNDFFSRLVLKTDKTFYLERQIVCIMAPCNPIVIAGTFRFTRSGDYRYLRLHADGDDEDMLRFAWHFDGTTLELRKTYTDDWFTVTRSEDFYCQDVEDCLAQPVPIYRVWGAWTCPERTCVYQSGLFCGGRGGTLCAEGSFCDYAPGATCGWADASGLCTAMPAACTDEYAPVCGCDSQTYSNACAAHSAGFSVLHSGPCTCEPITCELACPSVRVHAAEIASGIGV